MFFVQCAGEGVSGKHQESPTSGMRHKSPPPKTQHDRVMHCMTGSCIAHSETTRCLIPHLCMMNACLKCYTSVYTIRNAQQGSREKLDSSSQDDTWLHFQTMPYNDTLCNANNGTCIKGINVFILSFT